MTKPEPTDTIEYIGPLGQESPRFGPLVPGERYQCERGFAAYLTTAHPDFWRRPLAPRKPAGPEE